MLRAARDRRLQFDEEGDVLQVRGVTKTYRGADGIDVNALRGADLDVLPGQVVSLLGRNGAGKTTLLSIVAGLLRPDGGAVTIDGLDALADPEQTARLIGIAPQETGIYPILTVRQNLEFFGELNGLDRATRTSRATEVADQLGLTKLLDRRGGQLSGGEGRRLHTACALVHRPRLLMLDEPTVGADVATRLQLIEAVRGLAADGAAVVYTTHYLPEVEALDADVVIIDDGAVLAQGSQTQLIDHHHLRGVRFRFDGPLPAGRLDDMEPIAVGSDTHRVVGDIGMPELLHRLGADAERLISVETLRPDLETVFLAVTGHRLDDEAAGTTTGDHETERS